MWLRYIYNQAQRLGRRWIGIDITHLAVTLIRHWLKDAFGDEAAFSERYVLLVGLQLVFGRLMEAIGPHDPHVDGLVHAPQFYLHTSRQNTQESRNRPFFAERR